MTALASVIGYLELLIPINLFGIPGVKLGLANIVSLIALYLFGPFYAYLIMIARVLLTGVMFGNMYAIIYSLAGGFISITVMLLLKRSGAFSMTGVSAAGGAFHNIGQLIVAVISLGSLNILYYIPMLVITGTLFGCVTGILAGAVCEKIQYILYEREKR
jgi:heptaprenyl diphosphate synthase